eukprot:scaffold6389_cov75-Phaeocystis_antarctica.AAC.8
MAPAPPAHARHQSPSVELWIVGLDRVQCQKVSTSTNCINVATDCGQPKLRAPRGHLGQRLPANGLRVVQLRRVEHLVSSIIAAHGVELAIESDAAMQEAWFFHTCQLRPRGGLRVVQLQSAELSTVLVAAARKVNQAGPKAQAWHHLRAVDCGQHGHWPRNNSLAQEPLRHHREAHVLHHRKQLGLGPLGGLPPPLDPQEDGLLALGHQPVLLHQRQYLRARWQLRRQLLEAAQRRLHRGLLERRQREDVGEAPHVERVGRREPRPDRVGARVLERVDHQARGCLEHLGQQALVDLTFALVDEGQQRLERLRADALERVSGIRRVAHARLEEV